MVDETGEGAVPCARSQPSPEARERVLRTCRREMAARFRAERRRSMRRYWSLGIAVAALLALNAVQEQRITVRLGQITQARPSQAALAAPDVAGSVRARLRLLAALVRDPTTL
jgi:hypothetical protein